MIHTLPILTEDRPLTTHTLTDTEKIRTGLSCIFCVHLFKTARNILYHAWNLIFYFIITCLHYIDHCGRFRTLYLVSYFTDTDGILTETRTESLITGITTMPHGNPHPLLMWKSSYSMPN